MQYPRYPSVPRPKVSEWPRHLLLIPAVIMVLALAGCERTELQRADGVAVDWDSYRGQWVLVNYWAEWCKPCLEEIPELNHLDKSPGISVLGVNFDGVEGAAGHGEGHKVARRGYEIRAHEAIGDGRGNREVSIKMGDPSQNILLHGIAVFQTAKRECAVAVLNDPGELGLVKKQHRDVHDDGQHESKGR